MGTLLSRRHGHADRGYNSVVLRLTHPFAGPLSRFVFALTVLILSRGIGVAQTSSPAFWELLPEKVDAMLLAPPDGDKVRYARLLEYFSDLHCTGSAMEEPIVPKHGKNLICTLPGKDAEQIVVAARYEHRDRLNGVERGWNESVMLALLYNALRAELRQHTFVFVALSGRAGQDAFLESLRKKRRPSPKLLVVLDTLGLGDPWFYTAPEFPITAKGKRRVAMKKALGSEAAATEEIERIPARTLTLPGWALQNSLLSDGDEIPSILVSSALVSSATNDTVPPKAFHRNFEFLAYYLCRIDARFSNPIPN